MKRKLINIISPIVLIIALVSTILGYGFSEKGQFISVIPCLMAEILATIIIFFIANHNDREAKRKKRKKMIAKKRAAIRKAEIEAYARKAKAYQNSTFNFIISYDNEIENTSKESPFDPIEEIRVNLLCRNAMSRYRRNISR